MDFLSFLSKKEKKDDVLTSIFKIAEKGMSNIKFPISKEGKFEVMMFDIWLGTKLMEEKINIDYRLMQDKIEDHLKQTALKMGLPTKRDYELIYFFRKEGWTHDVMGLIHSDYPRTKQFLPGYLYLCVVSIPLLVFDYETTRNINKIEEIPLNDLSDFLSPFCEHYSWLVETITNSIK
jgi:hypothetical protein